jgi:hypothetical protein
MTYRRQYLIGIRESERASVGRVGHSYKAENEAVARSRNIIRKKKKKKQKTENKKQNNNSDNNKKQEKIL